MSDLTAAEQDREALLAIQEAWNDPGNNAQDVINAVGTALRSAGYRLKF